LKEAMMLFGSKMSRRTLALLQWECANINSYLATFGGRAAREALLDDSGEFIRVLGFPLPNGYHPPSADLVIIVADFPARPPYGLYLLNSDRAQVEKIKALFGAWHVQSWSTPDAIPGYTWICYHYLGQRWMYYADAPARGDNIAKFLRSFGTELEAGA
jgi:hypothetical protein